MKYLLEAHLQVSGVDEQLAKPCILFYMCMYIQVLFLHEKLSLLGSCWIDLPEV